VSGTTHHPYEPQDHADLAVVARAYRNKPGQLIDHNCKIGVILGGGVGGVTLENG
jgi:hypothetical protein